MTPVAHRYREARKNFVKLRPYFRSREGSRKTKGG